jgi:hypothetical protein
MTKDKETLATTDGIAGFGDSGDTNNPEPLFRVVAGHAVDYALEQSTTLISCAHMLSDPAINQDLKNAPILMTAVHYLSGMAKALSQEVSLAAEPSSGNAAR